MRDVDPARERRTTRRSLLRGLGATGIGAALAGCGSDPPDHTRTRPATAETRSPAPGTSPRTQQPSTEPPADAVHRTPSEVAPDLVARYDSVVDLADAGADPTGAVPITAVLRDHLEDDTLLFLPRGRYFLDESIRRSTFSNLAILGDGATIVPAESHADPPLFVLGGLSGATDLHVEGVHFDFSDTDSGPSPLYGLVEDRLRVRDVSVTGASKRVRLEMMTAAGSGLVERLHLPDGGTADGYPVGCSVTKYNRGTMTFVDCHVSGYPNNGLYASNSRGQVRVLGGSYGNNDISNVRVGDDAVVRNVLVYATEPASSFRNMRGIWVRGTGARIENCELVFDDVTASDGAIVLESVATVRDTHVEIHTDGVTAILGKDPTETEGYEDPGDVTTRVEGVTVVGNAATGSAMYVINHDGCVFEDVTVRQPGADRNGFLFYDVADATISASRIDVTGRPIVLNNSTVRTPETSTQSRVQRPAAPLRRDSD